MNLFQISLLFSLPVHTYLPVKQVIGRILFMCIWQGVQSATCTFQHLCLRTVWYGAAKIKIPERWQAVGMHNGGFSHRRVADHFRVNHSIIARLMQRFRQTGNVTDRPRAGRPRKTTPREDRLISRRARQRPFSTAGALRGNLALGGHIGTRTIIRRLNHHNSYWYRVQYQDRQTAIGSWYGPEKMIFPSPPAHVVSLPLVVPRPLGSLYILILSFLSYQ